MPAPLVDVLADVRTRLLDADGLVRAVAAGRRSGHPLAWRRAELRPVDLRAGRRLQVVRLDERQAHTTNHAYDDAGAAGAQAAVDALLAEPFGNWHVETTSETLQVRVTKKGDAQVHRTAATRHAPPERAHDRGKARLLDPGEPFLHALGLTTADGRVKPSRVDKVRQVEELLRALEPLLGSLPADRPLRVVDLGCGNAYLTFATYHYLSALGRGVEMVGVDVKKQSREHSSAVAEALGWAEHLRFVTGTISGALPDDDGEPPDVVLALHACDTATDDALARAVRWDAPVVVAAPCCHHDLQRQLRASTPPQPYGPLVRHGILRERFADVMTDALRAAVLRAVGYRAEVIEFVGSEHTPRNLLIRAVRTGAPAAAAQLGELDALCESWQVRPALMSRLVEELAAARGAAVTDRPPARG